MPKIVKNPTELIGNTPLLELGNYDKAQGLEATILAKLEYFNPLGSVKDRIGCAMIKDAEDKGLILLMPETFSVERWNLLKALGAELVLTPGSEGIKGAVKRAEELSTVLYQEE